MRSFSSFIALSALCTLSSFTHFACSSGEVDENNPADMYLNAEDDIESDRYSIALEKLRKIKNKFPYSKYSALAQLRIADVYFLQEAFGEAAVAYESFRDLHPSHEKVPYAMYRIGEAHYQDTPSNIARDMSAANKSLVAFQDFVLRFPKHELTTQANQRIQEVREKLAEKELYVATFYKRHDEPRGAKQRFEKIIKLYPDTPQAKTAKKKLEDVEKDLQKQKDTE